MSKFNYLLTFLFLSVSVFSQTDEAEKLLRKQNEDTLKGWKKGGVTSLSFTQTSLTNWSAGGQNSISLNGLISLFASRFTKNSAFDNTLDIGYGLINQGKEGKWIKSDDKFELTSKFGKKAVTNLYYAALFNIKTQLTQGYNYPNDSVIISDFLAPAYLLGSVGMDYKKSDKFTLFIAPVTPKITIVKNQQLADAGSFGVEPAVFDTSGNKIKNGKNNLVQLGGYLRSSIKFILFENVSVQSKFDIFSNYLKTPQNIDINWETLIALKFNKYISATLSTTLIYDDDTKIAIDENEDGITDKFGPRTQFKEIIGVGFLYKF